MVQQSKAEQSSGSQASASTSAAAATQGSRLIVKNLPRHASEQRLKEHFAAIGEVTDCRLRRTKEGNSRQFAFVGFRRAPEAQEAVAKLNRSFFDTARITVEFAHEPGSEALARPWSRYASGSSANVRLQKKPAGRGTDGDGADAKPDPKPPKGTEGALKKPPGARKVEAAGVGPRKAGVASRRVHVEFASSGEEDEEDDPVNLDLEQSQKTSGPAQARDREAFDDSLSDLAYMRAKKTKAMDAAEGGEAGAAECAGAEANAVANANTEADTDRGAGAVAEAGAGAEDSSYRENEDLASSGRLYVTNIPYGATDEELSSHFSALGEVASAVICKDEDTLKPRGFGYVSFAFPECAVRALSMAHLRSFQGRLLGISAARAKPVPIVSGDAAGGAGGTSSYKRKRRERQQNVEAHLEHTWNLLYVSANAATEAASAQLGMEKSELVGKDAENAAVTAALTETSIVQQTKRWLQREGIRVDAFQQSGASLAQSSAGSGSTRREDTFIVKHLPAGASLPELQERFARFGELIRCVLAPSGTVGLVQYTSAAQARRAFDKSAFARYRGAPLYLEWAPADVFIEGASTGAGAGAEGALSQNQDPDQEQEQDAAAGEAGGDGEEEGHSLFVKNLSFSTSTEALTAAFKACKGFRSAVIMKKVGPVTKAPNKKQEQQGRSMGYGFVEFASAAAALAAMKRKQGLVLDGHAVQLQISRRRTSQGKAEVTKGGKASKGLTTQRLCVRNLAFEATTKEVRQLFSSYGSVAAVRIPKKGDYTGHRGFAFLDFASKTEAAAAYEALQHTHFYGRRLVIEAAEEKPNDVGAVQLDTAKRKAAQNSSSEAKKRRTAGIFNAPGDKTSFEDAML